MGCPESLKYHRKYKYSSTGPPKYIILVEFTKKSLNSTISGRIPQKSLEMPKFMFFNDPGWFWGFL